MNLDGLSEYESRSMRELSGLDVQAIHDEIPPREWRVAVWGGPEDSSDGLRMRHADQMRLIEVIGRAVLHIDSSRVPSSS